jgi:hypothetical protein
MGFFGDRGLRKLRREAAAFRKLMEGAARDSQGAAAEPKGPISGADIAQLTASALRESLQSQAARGKETDAVECVREEFRGASLDVLTMADEMLGVAEPFLSARVENP